MLRKRAKRGRVGSVLAGAVGGLAVYFFDPEQGRTRRAKVRDKVVKLGNRGSGKAERAARYLGSQAYGIRQKAAHVGSSETVPPNDAALTAKVESEVLQQLNWAKGQVNFNSEDGVVYIRGELEDRDQIDEIEQAVRKVTGVVDVRNLVHTPGEPAPTS